MSVIFSPTGALTLEHCSALQRPSSAVPSAQRGQSQQCTAPTVLVASKESFLTPIQVLQLFLIKSKNAQVCFLDRDYLVIQVSRRHVGHHRSIKVHFSGLSVGSPLKAIFLLATSSFGRKSCHQSEVQTSANITSCQFYDLSLT